MEKLSTCGTGNSRCRTPKAEQIRLMNESITQREIEGFLAKIKAYQINIKLSTRKTKRRLGTAWPIQKRVVLYRHCSWVFLHELAHLLVGHGHGHNLIFARKLDSLVNEWNKFRL